MNKVSIMDKVTWCITTVFGTGYAPLCPGTAACVLAVPIFIFVKNPFIFFVLTLILVIVAFIFSGRAEKIFGEKDSKKIVIDDFAGQLITYLFIPCNIKFIISGFFLFRMFDMLKIPPANRIEKFHGSLGVVGDDVAAGIWANLVLHVVIYLLRIRVGVV